MPDKAPWYHRTDQDRSVIFRRSDDLPILVIQPEDGDWAWSWAQIEGQEGEVQKRRELEFSAEMAAHYNKPFDEVVELLVKATVTARMVVME